MSKALGADYEFNKDQFALELKNIMGSRKQADFARDCGLSVSLINQYLNARKETPPTQTTVFRMADATQDTRRSDALIKAAGYDPNKLTRNMPYLREDPLVVKTCLFNIMTCLSKYDFSWRPLPPEKLSFSKKDAYLTFDWGIALYENSVLKNWYFYFQTFPLGETFVTYLQDIYGSLSIFPFEPNTKISLVVSYNEEVDRIKDFPPLLLPIYVSVVYVDVINGGIIYEEYLQTANDIPECLNSQYKLSKGSPSMPRQE